MDDNKKFWSKTAGIYNRFVRGGRSANRAYTELENCIVDQLNPNMDVLELAAGPGTLSAEIASACKTLEITDFSPKMIERAKKSAFPPNVAFAVADATALKYESGTFDAVIIANALHVMPDPVKALREIRRVLKKDGLLIAPTFTRENMKNKLSDKLMEAVGFKTYHSWTHRSYLKFLAGENLQVCREKIITGFTYPISYVACRKTGSNRSVKETAHP